MRSFMTGTAASTGATHTFEDERVMHLVELALAQSPDDRDAYLEGACGGNLELLAEVRRYVEWENRMAGFLLKAVCPASPLDTHFETGELLDGRFRIIRKVAEGGMGLVYEATDERLQRRIALKCAKPGHGQRLPPEVRNATEISHPNVCKLYEIHTAQTRSGEVDFITMEFLEGETLSARLRRGALPEREARLIARQLCAGLAEAHRNRVIHGDLKSNNVILTEAPDGSIRAVITDFGLARKDGMSMRTLQSADAGGTPGYMAPELWRGERASVASDIYALGVILYELLAGHPPFESVRHAAAGTTQYLTPAQSLASHWSARAAKTLAPVHPKWDRALARCLDPDPAARFSTAAEIAVALEPSATRRRALYAAAAVLVAVASGVITYERATEPTETIRLAVLPFEADPPISSEAARLFAETSDDVMRLKGSRRTGFKAVRRASVVEANVRNSEGARAALDATHVLATVITYSDGRASVRGQIVNTQSGVALKQWEATYPENELKYASLALAGFINATFHLPAPPSVPAVNDAARADYEEGLRTVRLYSATDTALASLGHAVRSDPDNPRVWAGLAEAQWMKYALTRDNAWLKRAEESVLESQKRQPDLPEVLRAAGLVDNESGLYERAIASYRRAIELDSGNSDAFRRMGQALDRTGRSDEALAALRKAAELEPGYFRNYQSLGSHLLNHGRSKEAAELFRKALKAAPEEDQLHYRLAVALTNTGEFEEAERELRTAIRLRENANSLHQLGTVLMLRRRDSEAAQFFGRALAVSPDNVLSAAYLGLALERSHQPQDSKRAFQKAREIADRDLIADPRNSYSRGALAWACAALGERERARSEIAQTLQLSPDDSETLWFAVMTYEALGDRQATLRAVGRFTPEMLADANRFPALESLQHDVRFKKLLASNSRDEEARVR